MLSRRTILHCAALSGPLAMLPGLKLAAQDKAPKDSVNYQQQPKDGQQCSACRFFNKPDACQLVEGKINPDGWCSLFQAQNQTG